MTATAVWSEAVVAFREFIALGGPRLSSIADRRDAEQSPRSLQRSRPGESKCLTRLLSPTPPHRRCSSATPRKTWRPLESPALSARLDRQRAKSVSQGCRCIPRIYTRGEVGEP